MSAVHASDPHRGAERPRIVCPVARCRAANDAAAPTCGACGLPLAGYGRLVAFPAVLFSRGLRAARAGDFATARDAFASVVGWQPHDVEAHNAYALACLCAGDRRAARLSWAAVLARWPSDDVARRGLAAITAGMRPPPRPKAKSASRRSSGKRKR